MAITNLISYDLKGTKESFANWISNISPEETPFTSMIGKVSTTNKLFQWQTDVIPSVDATNAQKEGSDAAPATLESTTVLNNVTQILRRVVQVSDTADALDNYGRGQESAYQLMKAGKAIKRDLETILLSAQAKDDGSASGAGQYTRKTAGYQALIAGKGVAEADTGAVVHMETAGAGVLTEADIFKLTYNLYLANAETSIIMCHPKHSSVFSGMLEKGSSNGATRVRMFDNVNTIDLFVNTIVDPLGQTFKVVYNRFMPENAVYVFSPKDFDLMTLRAPATTKLAKNGSYDRWMIEMEVGLRLRNPFTAGALIIKA